MQRIRSTVLSLVLVLLAGTPFALLLWAQTRPDRFSAVDPLPAPLLLEAPAVTISGNQPVRITMEWDNGEELLAPPWQGLVTAVFVDAGMSITNGQPVAEVDGVSTVAVKSVRPFWRRLDLGDSGVDVQALQAFLREAGYYDGETDGKYGAATGSGVQKWQSDLGLVNSSTEFDPSLVVWLSVDTFEITEVFIIAGQEAPNTGEPFARGRPQLAKAGLLTLGGEPISLEDDEKWEVEVGGAFLVVDAITGSVASAELEKLAAIAGSSTLEIAGTIRRIHPLEAVGVPVAAVMTNAEGNLCVWTPNGSGFQAKHVDVGLSSVGRSLVLNGLKPGESILANPVEILIQPQCP